MSCDLSLSSLKISIKHGCVSQNPEDILVPRAIILIHFLSSGAVDFSPVQTSPSSKSSKYDTFKLS